MKKEDNKDIFKRLLEGEQIPMNDPEYGQVGAYANGNTFPLVKKLNEASNVNDVRRILGEIIGKPVDSSTTIFPPLYTNIGKNIELGKNVFINHACSFLDIGGITIEDDVMIGPRVTISSENHPTKISDRKTMVPAKVLLKKNAWIGASVTILPGITIGENAVVAAGAVVTKDVPDNVLVGGIPAKILKELEP